MFVRILVPLDGSRLAERALQPALQLAKSGMGELILLRVPEAKTMFEPSEAGLFNYDLLWPQQVLERSTQEAREYLETICSSIHEPDIRLWTLLIEGDPASIIVDTAAREQVDLIVMSTHGYSGIARWVMGSVTERVLRAAQRPVFIVRSSEPFRSILITLDGSELSEKALEPGIEMAARLDCPVTLFRSVTRPSVDQAFADQLEKLERGMGERVQRDGFRLAESYLVRLAKKHRRAGLDLKTVVATGPAASEILDFVSQHGVGLTVMATHGRSGLNRWVHGSVTEKVLRAGCCSMLIVPAGFEHPTEALASELGSEQLVAPQPSPN